jgi:NAD(P)-dependent dehydrogenase (short-subunit alcohol dehydrogenase family)
MTPTTPTPLDLRGKAAIVTGAAQGLGFAISKALWQAGMHVAMLDVQAEHLESAIHNIRALGADGGACEAIDCDLTDAIDTLTAVEKAISIYGAPRILIHNAAILIMRALPEVSFTEWQRTLNVGVQAAFIMTRRVWEPMTAAGGGSVVYVSSRSGVEGFANESAYCTAKHGLEGLMKALALEGQPRNIAVNTITPGMYMHTPMSERNYDAEAKQRWIDPMRLTPAFLHLARQDATGITGQRLSAWELSNSLLPSQPPA